MLSFREIPLMAVSVTGDGFFVKSACGSYGKVAL